MDIDSGGEHGRERYAAASATAVEAAATTTPGTTAARRVGRYVAVPLRYGVVPPMRQRLSLGSDPADARGRLLEGLAHAIEEKGYAATTIADVVGRAHVSKRTFYEHFADKEACYLALYSASSDHLLGVIATAVATDGTWEDRLHAAMRAYLSELAALPALTRTFLVEIQAAGPPALRRRRDVLGRFAEQLRALTEEAARDEPHLRPLSPELAAAVVGGINELQLLALEQGDPSRLPELADTAAELIRSVVSAPVVAR